MEFCQRSANRRGKCEECITVEESKTFLDSSLTVLADNLIERIENWNLVLIKDQISDWD